MLLLNQMIEVEIFVELVGFGSGVTQETLLIQFFRDLSGETNLSKALGVPIPGSHVHLEPFSAPSEVDENLTSEDPPLSTAKVSYKQKT